MLLDEVILLVILFLFLLVLLRASRRRYRRAGAVDPSHWLYNLRDVWSFLSGTGRRRVRRRERRESSSKKEKDERRRVRQDEREQRRLAREQRIKSTSTEEMQMDDDTNTALKVPGPSLGTPSSESASSTSSRDSLGSSEEEDDSEGYESRESDEWDEEDEEDDGDVVVDRSWAGITIWTRVYNSIAYDWVNGNTVISSASSGGYTLPSSKPGDPSSLSERVETNFPRTSRRKRILKGIYEAGWVWAIIAMVVAILIVVWSATNSWVAVLNLVVKLKIKEMTNSTVEAGKMIKRSFEEEPQLLSKANTRQSSSMDSALSWVGGGEGSVVKPLIPGITVPISHLFPLLLSLFLCQLIHEAGHLVAAAVEGIKPLQVGISFWWGLVSAGVAFGRDVEASGIRPRLRIASSGPFHNFLTYLALLLITLTGVPNLFYHDYTLHGRNVIAFTAHTPAQDHMPKTAIIQYVDDIFIGGKEDIFQDYMRSSRVSKEDEDRGWCVDLKRYKATTRAPCHDHAPVAFETYPFSSSPFAYPHDSTEDDLHCLPPYPLLTTRTWPCPCSLKSQVCVQPHPSESITRIQWLLPGEETLPKKERNEKSRVLLWKGERQAFLDGVKTGRYAARGGETGRWILGVIEVIFGYISTLSLTLALLNLLPLPKLDGEHVLKASLDLIYPGTSDPLEDIEDGTGKVLVISEDQTSPPRIDKRRKEAEDVSPTASIESKRHRKLVERSISWGCGAIVILGLGGMSVGMAVEQFGSK